MNLVAGATGLLGSEICKMLCGRQTRPRSGQSFERSGQGGEAQKHGRGAGRRGPEGPFLVGRGLPGRDYGDRHSLIVNLRATVR